MSANDQKRTFASAFRTSASIDRDAPRTDVEGHQIFPEAGSVNEEAFVRTSIYKDRAWSYEKEIRTFIVLKKISVVENGVYFKQLNERLALREVLLGPRCSLPIEAIDALVRDRYEGVTVRKTELAGKVFAVLPVRRRQPS